jgi:hypothetical protein
MSKLLSFVAGAAEGFSEMIDKSEKSAKEEAALRVRRLMENHKEVMESNLKLENELKAEEGWIKTYFSNATPEQVAYLQSNPAALQALKKMPDPTKVGELGNVIKIAAANEAASVTQDQLTALPAVANEVAARVKEKARSTGFFRNLADEAGERVGITTERSLARGLGTTIEQMESIKRTARPSIEGAFDVAKTMPPKTLTQQTEQAQINLIDALRSGDDTKIDAARIELNNFTKAKDAMTPEQTQFSNKVADIKNRYMFGDAETRKAAKPEYDKLMADIRAEAMAKKTGEGAGTSASEKIPALGTLNTFTSAAVARAVAGKHGDLIKTKQLAIVEKADGSVGIDYIGDNETLRRQILETQANAARNALSLYTDAKGQPFNRDVASVLNSYTSVVPSIMRDSNTAQPAQTTTPTAPAVRNFTSVAEAEKAKLPKGTRITINGRPAEVQ